MMIFASDLDRTLVYSTRALDELGWDASLKLDPIEFRDGASTAFMTRSAISLLRELSKNALFVPVTTRTTEQYERFVLFKEEIPIKYAITNNGAVILYNGKPLQNWSETIAAKLEEESLPPEEFRLMLNKEKIYLDGQLKEAGSLFFYYILNRFPSNSALAMMNVFVSQYGWRTSLQGRKLYFIPIAISKGAALQYICQLESKEAYAGAGDSILDWDFLQFCRYRFVPNHGELAKSYSKENIYLTKNQGILAGEEILQQLHALITLKI